MPNIPIPTPASVRGGPVDCIGGPVDPHRDTQSLTAMMQGNVIESPMSGCEPDGCRGGNI